MDPLAMLLAGVAHPSEFMAAPIMQRQIGPEQDNEFTRGLSTYGQSGSMMGGQGTDIGRALQMLMMGSR